METIFREKAQPILIYIGIETEIDPFSHEVETSMLNALPIQGIVSDISPASAQWKMPGITTSKTREIIIEKKYKTLIEQSQKIQILGDDTLYTGWKVSGRLQMREEGDYVRLYIFSKTTE